MFPKMKLVNDEYNIYKTTTFYADSYIIKHDFVVDGSSAPLFVLWKEGILPTEKNLYEDLIIEQLNKSPFIST